MTTKEVSWQLKAMLKDISIRCVAAAAIAQPENRRCIGITTLPNAVPIPAKTITCKLTGFVRQADVDVPAIANAIVDAV